MKAERGQLFLVNTVTDREMCVPSQRYNAKTRALLRNKREKGTNVNRKNDTIVVAITPHISPCSGRFARALSYDYRHPALLQFAISKQSGRPSVLTDATIQVGSTVRAVVLDSAVYLGYPEDRGS